MNQTQLEYEKLPPPAVRRRSAERAVYLSLFWILIIYGVISTCTLPLLNALWLGEIPPFALPQAPKTELANAVRVEVAMPLIRMLGLSRGSFSPDFIMARPYALAIVYLLPMALLIGVSLVRTKFDRRFVRLSLVLTAIGIIDFIMTLVFAGGPSLSVY